ncbi:glycoside hydrolase superfamily [Elsinoe ampelina]|uniref:chitinase n=1 Tax=Elsinoe ampelina TaxID=302913 RepID=A0A6A6GIW1_9PEZI|nr:glycoside hydrolase superfamily [Elsinoe ampelina]
MDVSDDISSYVHGAYYPSWRVYKGETPSSMRLDLLNHLTLEQHLDKKADLDISVDGTKGCLSALRLAKATTHERLQLMLSVGGGSGSAHFPALASTSTGREQFATSCRSWVDQYGFDGIDLDWEHPSSLEQGRDFLALVQALRNSLPVPRYKLSAALPAGEWCLRNVPLARVGSVLDNLNLMCYDFVGPWTGVSGYHSQLYSSTTPQNPYDARSAHTAISFAITQGIPANKIVMGIPAYGRSFADVDSPGKPSKASGGGDGTVLYRDLPLPDMKEQVQRDRVAAYCTGQEGGFVSYDVPETVVIKCEYVKAQGLGGVFYWTGVGDATGERSLVAHSHRALFSKK